MLDQGQQEAQPTKAIDVRDVVRQALEEFVRGENQKSEPAYKAELEDERRRRESPRKPFESVGRRESQDTRSGRRS